MPNVFKSEKISSDFDHFKEELLKSSDIIISDIGEFEPYLKKYHKLTYSLALFPLKLNKEEVEKNKYIFLYEIQSDLLNIISLLAIGFNLPARILLRRVIENFYNHIYYSDHSVEYTQLNLGKNDYTPLIELKDYFTNHPKFGNVKDENIKEYNIKMFNTYVELNKVVHTKGLPFMGLSKNLQEIKFANDYKEFVNLCNETLVCAIYLLYKFHKEITFSMVENGLILSSVPKNKRLKMSE